MMRFAQCLQDCWRRLSRYLGQNVEQTQVIDCPAQSLEVTPLLVCEGDTKTRMAAPKTKVPDRFVERRATVRHPCDLEAFCRPSSARQAEFSFMARVRNLSAGGVGFILSNRFDPGTVLLMEFQISDARAPRLLPLRVVHARQLPYGGWFLGGSFPQQLAEAEVQALLGGQQEIAY